MEPSVPSLFSSAFTLHGGIPTHTGKERVEVAKSRSLPVQLKKTDPVEEPVTDKRASEKTDWTGWARRRRPSTRCLPTQIMGKHKGKSRDGSRPNKPSHGGGIEKKAHLNMPSGAAAEALSLPAAKANPQSRTSSTTRAHLTTAAFSSLSLSAKTARAVSEVLCYENMTLVQEATLPAAMEGHDR